MFQSIINYFLAIFILVSSYSATASEAAYINIAASEVAAAAEHNGKVFIKLTPDATARFQEFTREHIGRPIKLSIIGVPAMQVVAHSEITSGVIEVHQPSIELRNKLGEIEKRIPSN
jgi:hypothetical protein